MRNFLRFVPMLSAAFLTVFLFSCEKEALEPATSPVDQIAFTDAVEYGKDGSFSYSLTSEQMAYILENEFDQAVSSDIEAMSMAFARLAAGQIPQDGKPGSFQEKMVTYGLGAQVVTLTTSGNYIIDFDGIGGLPATAGPVTVSADGFRRQNLTINMSAICYAFTSAGDENIFFRNDSSADVGICPGKSFERNLRGDAKITFDGPANITGSAVVRCTKGIIADAPQEIEICC